MSTDDHIERTSRPSDSESGARTHPNGRVILSSTLVLLITHLYAALVAEVGQKGRWLSHAERHTLVADNIPLLVSLLVPTALISLAGLGVLSLRAAIEQARR